MDAALRVQCFSPIEVDFDIFSEAGGVVITDRLGVAERLEQRARLEDLLRDLVVGRLVDGGEVLHHQLGALRLARPGLTAGRQTTCLC